MSSWRNIKKKPLTCNHPCYLLAVSNLRLSGVFDNVTREHLIKSIVEHLYCSGYSHVAHELELESGFETKNKDIKEKFLFLSELLTDLRNSKHDKVLDWIYENRQKLIEKNSFIEWKVRRIEFCQLLISDDPCVPVGF